MMAQYLTWERYFGFGAKNIYFFFLKGWQRMLAHLTMSQNIKVVLQSYTTFLGKV